jgi:hypothetical protein
MKKVIVFLIIVFISNYGLEAQTIPAGFPVWEDAARRSQLLGQRFQNHSFGSRPIRWDPNLEDSLLNESFESGSPEKIKKIDFQALPILSTSVYNSNRPYGWGNSSLMNGKGLQNLTSAGIYAKLFFLEIQLRPEFAFSQNLAYTGYGSDFSDNTNFARFRYWNFGDHPERFPEEFNTIASWGQSYLSINIGPVEIGAGTQNIWWGPGQFTSLIFSNNAQGIKHLFLRTSKPANIFIGTLEAQFIMGRAEDSGVLPSQNDQLNGTFAIPFSGDWRYVNGLSLTYQPVFLPHFFVGFNRTFQQYNEDVPKNFQGRVPVFEAFQKERLFQNDNSVIYDGQRQDQQVSVFFRYFNPKSTFEIYAEYGKRDHNFNWRDFLLNPEHARAYLMGFSKLIKTEKKGVLYEIRAELVQQKESVNRYIRYPDLNSGNTSWQTHYQVRGFTNQGLGMGTGIGVGANIQILEISRLSGLNKVGLRFERLENHQDFYYRAFENDPSTKPWVDLGIAFLYDRSWKGLMLRSKVQAIQSSNYQWQSTTSSTADFSNGKRLFTIHSSINLIYHFGSQN